MSDKELGKPPFTRGEKIADDMLRIGDDGIWIQEVGGIELRDIKSIRGRVAIEIDEAYRQGERQELDEPQRNEATAAKQRLTLWLNECDPFKDYHDTHHYSFIADVKAFMRAELT